MFCTNERPGEALSPVSLGILLMSETLFKVLCVSVLQCYRNFKNSYLKSRAENSQLEFQIDAA